MNKQYTFTEEQYAMIDGLTPSLHSIMQQLENFLAPQILKEIKDVYDTLNTALQEHRNIEDHEEDLRNEKLEKISNEHSFYTCWSLSNFDVEKMNDLMPFETGTLIVRNKKVTINRTMTWLEAWQAVDNLIVRNSDHIFIEDFSQDEKNNEVYVFMGS